MMIDLVATLIFEAEEKLDWAENSLNENLFGDSIYHSYATIISAAKALLLGKSLKTNTQNDIINDFDKHFVDTSDINLGGTFREFVLQINKNEPTKQFAETYLRDAKAFIKQASALRERTLKSEEIK